MSVKGKLIVDKEQVNAREARIRALKKEVSRKASLANKRLKRLENKGLTEMPAYRQWVDYGGGVKFSVRGKDYNELQAELSRVNHFIDSKTSTIRGGTKMLKDMAATTGIEYENVGELYNKTRGFFNIVSKVQQYLANTTGMASAIGYQQIWKVVNEYVQKENINLGESLEAVDDMLHDLVDLTVEVYEKEAQDVIFDSFTDLF